MIMRSLLRIVRDPALPARMWIDGTEYHIVRIKVHDDLIEVLFENLAEDPEVTA